MTDDSDSGGIVTATGWIWGIAYSVMASLVGGASKLSIRKSCEFPGRPDSCLSCKGAD